MMRRMGNKAAQTMLQSAIQRLLEIPFERLSSAIVVWGSVFVSIVASSLGGSSRGAISLVAVATFAAATFSIACATWLVDGLYRLNDQRRQRQAVVPEKSAQPVDSGDNKRSPEEQAIVTHYGLVVDELISQRKIIFALDVSNQLDGDLVFGRTWVGRTGYGTKTLYGAQMQSEDNRGIVIPSKETRRISIVQRLPYDLAQVVSERLETGDRQSFNLSELDIPFVYNAARCKLPVWPRIAFWKGEHGVLKVGKSPYASASARKSASGLGQFL
jgi:hypothetical protein